MGAGLLMIALDGADARTLNNLANQGVLPEIAKLMRRGKFSYLRNAEELSDDSAWASFCFGSRLSEHQRYHFERKGHSGNCQMAFHGESGSDAFWTKLSELGHRVGVIDIPKCPTPVVLNGIHIADWLVHGKYHHQPVSFPASLAEETVNCFGSSPASRCDYYQEEMTPEEAKSFAGHLNATISQKLSCGLHHLDSSEWDLFLIGFKEAHCAGHGLWHVHDTRHPQFAASECDLLIDVYVKLDEAVGKLARAAGHNANVMVFSTFDMVPNGSLWHMKDQIEARLNHHLRRLFATPVTRGTDLFAHLTGRTGRIFCEVVPANDNLFALHIHAPGSFSKDEICMQAEKLLRELQDTATGNAAFVSVRRTPWKQREKSKYRLPDLVGQCAPGRFPATLVSKTMGEISAVAASMRTGNHVAGGGLMAVGHAAIEHAAGVTNLHELGGVAELVLATLKER